MMRSSEASSLISASRKAVAALRAALLSPAGAGDGGDLGQELQPHITALQVAAGDLDSLRWEWPRRQSNGEQTAELRRQLRGLAQELAAAARLADQGLRIARGTARLLAPLDASYLPDGEPVLRTLRGVIAVKG